MNKHPMVWVRWRDPTIYNDDWRDPDESIPVLTIHTIGYLLHNDKKRVVVASSMCEGEYDDIMVIPPSVVESITRLNNGRKIRKKKA